MDNITVPVLKLEQKIGDLYVTVLYASDLYSIAEVDRIRMEKLEVPKYAGFQRALAKDRVNSIRNYLDTPRATFPNSIICSVDSDFIKDWEDQDNQLGLSIMTIERNPGAVRIIDGQHRAAALDRVDVDFRVIVTFFVDLNIEQSAEIFEKINSTQKPVNPSIAFQLFGYSEDRSPQKTAHYIAEVMNNTDGSPFYRQLRMLGTKDQWAIGTLSQATFAKKLMRLYTRNAEHDQNKILRGDELEMYQGYPLRNLFIDGEDDKILGIVWKYFFVIAETWSDQWNDIIGDSVLVKTTGYSAFIEMLRYWLLSERRDELFDEERIKDIFLGIAEIYSQPDTRFIRENYPSGSQGEIKLRKALMSDIGIEK